MEYTQCRIRGGDNARKDGGVEIVFTGYADQHGQFETVIIAGQQNDAPYLTRKGWQVSEHPVQPDRITVEGRDLIVSLGPQLAQHIEEYAVLEIWLVGADLTGRLVWRRPVIAGEYAPPPTDMPEPDAADETEDAAPVAPPRMLSDGWKIAILVAAAAIMTTAIILISSCPWCEAETADASGPEDPTATPVESEADRLYREGMAAVRAGEAVRAHDLLDRAAARDHCDSSLHLAQSYRSGPTGDDSVAARGDPREALRYLAIACQTCADRARPALESLIAELNDPRSSYAGDDREIALEDLPIVRSLCR